MAADTELLQAQLAGARGAYAAWCRIADIFIKKFNDAADENERLRRDIEEMKRK
jgi:hypothetical protein